LTEKDVEDSDIHGLSASRKVAENLLVPGERSDHSAAEFIQQVSE
jgi:hypothetical protein